MAPLIANFKIQLWHCPLLGRIDYRRIRAGRLRHEVVERLMLGLNLQRRGMRCKRLYALAPGQQH
jgi:hypothetical protein